MSRIGFLSMLGVWMIIGGGSWAATAMGLPFEKAWWVGNALVLLVMGAILVSETRPRLDENDDSDRRRAIVRPTHEKRGGREFPPPPAPRPPPPMPSRQDRS